MLAAVPYRDARHALEARRDDLRRELDTLRVEGEALRRVVCAQEAVERELSATNAKLAELAARHASRLEGRGKKQARRSLYVMAGALGVVAIGLSTLPVMRYVSARRQAAAATRALPAAPDRYVHRSLYPHPAPGVSFLYRREPQPGQPGLQWTLWADGRTEIVVNGQSPPPDSPFTADGQIAAYEILALSRELRPEAIDAVAAYGDSAVVKSYELFGTGARNATDADRARLFDLAARLRFSGDHRY